MVKTFGWKHDYVLHMPIKRFWFYNKQVDRLAAEEGLRQLNLMAAVTSQEGYSQAVERLEKQMGEIFVLMPKAPVLNLDNDEEMDPEFDRAAFQAFKAQIAAQGR